MDLPGWAVFWVRFVVGGFVIAMIPYVGRRFGPDIAGVMVLLPVVTLVGLTFLGMQDKDSIGPSTRTAIAVVPALVAFLYMVRLLAPRHSLFWTMVWALVVWVAVACLFALVLRWDSVSRVRVPAPFVALVVAAVTPLGRIVARARADGFRTSHAGHRESAPAPTQADGPATEGSAVAPDDLPASV